MKILSALLAGLVFGLGLVISEMINPAKVQNFLDVFGNWDLSLIFVMIGAIAVGLPGFRYLASRNQPLFADKFQLPTKTKIDSRLVIGSSIFGIGWGMIGFCPGPLITAAPLLAVSALIFIPAMVVGMWAVRLVPASSQS